MQIRELTRKQGVRGIKIGDLSTFKTESPLDKSMKPVDKDIKDTEHPPLKGPTSLTEKKNLFIFGQKTKNRDDPEIRGN